MPDAAAREKNEWDERDGRLVRGAPSAVPVLAATGLLILYELLPVLELAALAALLALVLRTLMLWIRTEQTKQPALTSTVAKLERDGLIECRPDPSDGRASVLSLTADGQSIVSRRHADRVERLRSLIDRLSPADRTRLLSIAGVRDQIVQLANEQVEKPNERSGK